MGARKLAGRRVLRFALAAVTAGGLLTGVLGTPAPAQPEPGAPATGSGWLPATPDLWPQVVSANQTTPQQLTSGVSWNTEKYQTTSGAQRAQVMHVDLSNPNVRLGMVEAGDRLVDPADETISSMADRTGAVAGVNADFFSIHASGQPLGMVVQNGVLEASPVPSWPYDVEVLKNGQVKMATETFSGSAADGSSSQPLAGVNRTDQSGLVAVTPFLGATPISSAVVATGTTAGGSDLKLTITSVASGVTSLPQLGAGQEDLMAPAGSAAAAWLTGSVHSGDTVTLAENLAPYNDVQTAVSGGAQLVSNGAMAVPLQGSGENNVSYPVVGIGVNQAGTGLIMATFDGEETESSAVGLTRPQFAQWMMAHGAYNAVEFDSGGSSEMVGRHPGDSKVSVLNVPSDGGERPVANGLFVYSAEAAAGPAADAVVNGGKPLTLLSGTTAPVGGYALDAAGNPAAQTPQVSAVPATLAQAGAPAATATGGDTFPIHALRSGHGQLTVRAGQARAAVPLRVASKLTSLSVSPSAPDLANGAAQALTPSGLAGGAQVPLPADQVTWSVTPASLGTVSSSGVFTAATTGSGLATVTATAGGQTGTASIAVGQQSSVIDPMSDVDKWAAYDGYMYPWPRHVPANPSASTSDGSISQSTSVTSPDGQNTMDVHYNFPGGQHVYNLDVYPQNLASDPIPAKNGTQPPEAVGVWVKGNAALATTPPGTQPLANGAITLSMGMYQANNQPIDFYPTAITWDGWRLAVANLPGGMSYPLALNYLALVVIDPPQTDTGDIYLSDLEALYSPRTIPAPQYTPIPHNPGWLNYVSGPSSFTPGGTTVASFDDAHLVASNTGATSDLVLNEIKNQLAALPAADRPAAIQTQGDMSDTGDLANLQYLKSTMDGFGIPYHMTVGNHEISQGSLPETGNYTSVFGPTHYTYTAGPARFVDIDTAHGGVTGSDPYQVPAGEQYQWLVSTLSANTSPDVVIVTHEPPYDPHPVKNSQFGDAWEAQMFEELAMKYQASHPWAHVIVLLGHARGFSEQLLDQYGNQVTSGGLPNFVVADAGVEPYATPDQGGFYNYALFHFLPSGKIQFAVQPVLTRVTVAAPSGPVSVGHPVQMSATGDSPAGNDLSDLQVPIADPASHVWSSSDPGVASIDPDTGLVTPHHAGSVTISCEAGGYTGSVTLAIQQ